MIVKTKANLHRIKLYIPKTKIYNPEISRCLYNNYISNIFREKNILYRYIKTIKHEQLKELKYYQDKYTFTLSNNNNNNNNNNKVLLGINPKTYSPLCIICFNIHTKNDLIELNSIFPAQLSLSSIEYALDCYTENTADLQTLFRRHLIVNWKHQQKDYRSCSFIGGKANILKYYERTSDGPLRNSKGELLTTKQVGEYVRIEFKANRTKIKKIFGNNPTLEDLIEDAHFEEMFSKMLKLRVLNNYRCRNKTLQQVYDDIKKSNKTRFLKHREDLDIIEDRMKTAEQDFDREWTTEDLTI